MGTPRVDPTQIRMGSGGVSVIQGFGGIQLKGFVLRVSVICIQNILAIVFTGGMISFAHLWGFPLTDITCQNPGGCGGSDRTALIAGKIHD